MWTKEEVEHAVPNLAELLAGVFNAPRAQQTESITAEETVPLVERAIASDGTFLTRLIRPGWGSSGFYSREVLERDGKRVWPKGTKMYANHPSLSEERDRPERDIRDIAAVLTEDPVFLHDPKHGPGLYSRAQIIDTWRPQIEALANSPAGLDLSIRADGIASHGEAEGRKGRIVERIDKGRSVDFVTDGGAGGKVISLSESARMFEPLTRETCERDGGTWNAADSTCAKKEKVKESSVDELKEAQTALAEAQRDRDSQRTRADRAEGALSIIEARSIATAQLASMKIPDAAKQRVVDSVSLNAPHKDGKIDADAYKTIVEKAAQAEADYLRKVTGSQTIKGMGDTTQQPLDVTKELTEAFTVLSGGDAEAAKRMAAGRGN